MPWILHDNGDPAGPGLERGFIVCVPPDWWDQAGPLPVFLEFHAGHHNMMDSFNGISLHKLLGAEFQAGLIDDVMGLPVPKAVVVYIQAQGMLLGPTGRAVATHEHGTTEPVNALVNADDVGFCMAVLELLQTRMTSAKQDIFGVTPEVGGPALDLSRVWVVGYSGGAMMVHRLGVELVTRFGLIPEVIVAMDGTAGGARTAWEMTDDAIGGRSGPVRWFPLEHGMAPYPRPHVLIMMGLHDWEIPGWSWSPPTPPEQLGPNQKLDPDPRIGDPDEDLNPKKETALDPGVENHAIWEYRYRFEVSTRVWAEYHGANPPEPLDRLAIGHPPRARFLKDGKPNTNTTPLYHWHYRTGLGGPRLPLESSAGASNRYLPGDYGVVLGIVGPDAGHESPAADNAWGFDPAPLIWEFCIAPHSFGPDEWLP